MSEPPVTDALVRHYEARLAEHGATPQGVDWPDAEDLAVRFEVMLGALAGCRAEIPAILDVGCGPGLLLDHLRARGRLETVEYLGLDASARMVEVARARWPGYVFERRDLLAEPLPARSADLVVMNGLFTVRAEASHAAMEDFARRMIAAAFRLCRHAVAFNVMSAHVEWTRDDLFHWPYDALATFLTGHVTRHYAVRADYGLYEYTVYLFREPRR